jgi:hypothetical protein
MKKRKHNMKLSIIKTMTVFAAGAFGLTAFAQPYLVQDGTTSVSLNTDVLASAAGLTVSGAADTVTPLFSGGGAGFTTVGFDITPASTFSYSDGLAPFGGTIEHTGTVTFTVGAGPDTLTLGNFRIGYDAVRVGGDRSGFFVQDTFSLGAILFDIGSPSVNTANSTTLAITGSSLLVSSELGGFLVTQGLSASNLTGAVIGSAQINASAIPEPSSFALLAAVGALGLAIGQRRRRPLTETVNPA